MNEMQVTERLAAYVESIRELELDSSLVKQVKKVLIDYLCSALTGTTTEVSRQVYQFMLESEGAGEFNIIGHGKGLSKSNAAFVNAASAHSLDMDDGHTGGSIHPGTVVFPAVLAAAQMVRPTFEELSKAIIAGYEVCLRISYALHPSSRKRGFHNTPVAGIFGATAAVCVLYGFKKINIQNAFGVAASFAGGLFAFLGTGSEVKRIHPGQAARDSIIAVELTKRGLSGPKSVLECENGVFQAFAGSDVSLERMFHEIGKSFEMMNVYFKPYPCCRHLHSSVDAVYELKNKYSFKAGEISRVRVGVNHIAYMHRHKQCETLLDAQMSLPYAVASALIHPSLEVNHFDPQLNNERITELLHLVDVYVDEEADRMYPKERAAKVEIILTNGRKYNFRVANPLGEPSNPISFEQVITKFMTNCTPIIGEEKASAIIENVRNLENGTDFLFDI